MPTIINLNSDCPNAIITEYNLRNDFTLNDKKTYIINCLLADRTYDQPLFNLVNNSQSFIINGCINEHTLLFQPYVEQIISYRNDKYDNIAAASDFLVYGKTILCRTTDGCKGHCAYCNMGGKKPYSYSSSQIIQSIKTHITNDISSILLYGNDISFYEYENNNLIDLIHILHQEFNLPITVSCLPPNYVLNNYDTLRPLIQQGFFRSIGVSIQSASELVLENMDRQCDLQAIHDIFTDIKAIKPKNTFAYSEFIYGFYGETFHELSKSLKFACVFDYVMWYRYMQLVGSRASIKYADLIIGKDYSNEIYDFAITTKRNPIKIHNSFFNSQSNKQNVNWVIF